MTNSATEQDRRPGIFRIWFYLFGRRMPWRYRTLALSDLPDLSDAPVAYRSVQHG